MLVTPTRLGDLIVRPATLDDASVAADIHTADYPSDPTDPKIERYRWKNMSPDFVVRRLVAERNGRPVGVAGFAHAKWEKVEKRFAWVWATLAPDARTPERLDGLFALVEDAAREDGTHIFSAGTHEDNAPTIAQLTARGYREDRRGKDWELDLVGGRERLLGMQQASRERMRRAGIEVTMMSAVSGEHTYRSAWRCFEEAAEDMPTTIPRVPQPFEQFMKWLRRPGMREDRFWIARTAGEVVGISVLEYPPVRGHVTTAWTGTSRSVRGKGVARALKLETIAQAIPLGVARIRTGNDAANAPILKINADLGYQPIPGWIQFLKEA